MSTSSLDALVKTLGTAELDELLSLVREELTARRADEMPEVDVLVRRALDRAVRDSSVEAPIQVAPGVLAVGGMIKESSSGSHKCELYTVIASDEAPERWVWDEECDGYITSEISRVGTKRVSVAILSAATGQVFVRHRMTCERGKHSRTATTAYKVTQVSDSGEVFLSQVQWNPATLPPPHSGGGR